MFDGDKSAENQMQPAKANHEQGILVGGHNEQGDGADNCTTEAQQRHRSYRHHARRRDADAVTT